MAGNDAELDVLITVRDLNDEEAGIDDVLFGCALRKDMLPAFLADMAALARSYGGKDFVELADEDDDSVIMAARCRWFADAARDTIDCAQSVLDGRFR